MHFRETLYIFAILLLLSNCGEQVDIELTNTPQQIVVDGWIEAGNYAHVYLTYSSDYFSNVDSSKISKLVITWAKISLVCNADTEILNLKVEKNFFPPRIYKGNRIKGKVGNTYKIIAELDGKVITATTTIPKAVFPDTMWYEKTANSDTAISIYGKFTDNIAEKNYYKIVYMIKGKQKRYYSAFKPIFNDGYFNGRSFTFKVEKGPESYITSYDNTNFTLGDTVFIKIYTIDELQYFYWAAYQSEILSAGNPFASTHNEIKSNIIGPALGIWTGYGVETFKNEYSIPYVVVSQK